MIEARPEIVWVERVASYAPIEEDPSTPDRERKRMARLILEDVTLNKGDDVAVYVRFKGGATSSLTVPRAKASWEERQTRQEVVALIDRLLDEHTDSEAAAILNARGLVSGTGKPFSGDRVATIRRAYRLKDRWTRLREAGMVSLDEVADKFGVNAWVIKSRRLRGQLPIASHASTTKASTCTSGLLLAYPCNADDLQLVWMR